MTFEENIQLYRSGNIPELPFAVGDWVKFEKNPRNHFGLIVDIQPAYATIDLERKDVIYHKGERIGDNVFVKKITLGSRVKMPRCEALNAHWCEKVTDEERKYIETYFTENPDRKKIFDETPFALQPAVDFTRVFELTDEQAQELENLLKTIEGKPSVDEIETLLEEKGFMQHYFHWNKQGLIQDKEKAWVLSLGILVTEYNEAHTSHLTCGYNLQRLHNSKEKRL